MDNLNKSNEDRKVEKIITGKVTTKKKGALSKAFGEFISDDAKNVSSYVFSDIIVPSLKDVISSIVSNGIDMILYGESRQSNKRSTADRVSYRNYSNSNSSNTTRNSSRISSAYSHDDIILDTRADAEEVIARMDELMDTYNLVRVADLYDLVGITGSYTDNKYGWYNIRSAEVVRVREGYMIKMPRAVAL